ncbi:phosphotyrosine-specific ptp2-like protein [Saxophila tyrrhenica]|uniref:protein-tyrosine-phosphatase n=1 Tax=Saxophila tyrrhenica TaxID=1690608 RepID=A0AAV9P9I3_9PEZI|nr:phosphotyrosine-specific ptp2-like protein [Saxophila tyrrhenica]
MTETATSSRLHSNSRSSRPTTTPAARPPNNHPGSVGQTMPPLLSPRTPRQPSIPSVNTPSPNYFGFQTEDASFPTKSAQHSNGNWSPPSSKNPDYDAFRRQSEGKAFNLGGLGSNFSMSMPAPPKPDSHRRTSSKVQQPKEKETTAHRRNLEPGVAELGRSPKRVLSPGSMILPEEVRRASPASFTHSESGEIKDATLDSQPRFALPLDKKPQTPMSSDVKPRAETLPASTGSVDAQPMVTAQHVVNLLEAKQVLLLDLRVQTQYARSHIAGALNLCIPTTLLKRPSFNVQKLADAFKDEEQKRQFQRWRSSGYIIVYDGSSSLMKDATICLNTIKKFKSEGYDGTLYIIKGGFTEFSRRFPSYIETSFDSDQSDGVDSEGPEIAPVMGGCPMPSTDKPANPFFGNIRQNMDLIGGVGQIALKHPNQSSKSVEKDFPEWLRQAAEDADQGKKVASKFEHIERREKKRMEDALSGKVSYVGSQTPKKQSPGGPALQIAGIEKGAKNRYNNIWPFEHCRVKLQGVPTHTCDYFNASFVKAAWSRKRYISTQAPIPATFNDFWNVVWQQDVRVIVMLTAEKEGAQVKAHNYWTPKSYGGLKLDFLSEKRASIDLARIHRHRHPSSTTTQRPSMQSRASGPQIPHTQLDSSYNPERSDEPHVIVRRFTLSHERFPFEPIREITQLQYSSWPDFGAPAHPADLLGLVEQCDNVVRQTGTPRGSDSSTGNGGRANGGTGSASEPVGADVRPVLVHCSAGCGRTGTFCTVDSVIDMLKRQRISREEDAKEKSKVARRGGTPMDIDSPPPKSTTVARTLAASKNEKASGGFDFFTSTTTAPEPSWDDGIDGAWVQRDDLDLVEKTVEDFRRQRISMVQSLRQYVLCYESVMEWLVEQHQMR